MKSAAKPVLRAVIQTASGFQPFRRCYEPERLETRSRSEYKKKQFSHSPARRLPYCTAIYSVWVELVPFSENVRGVLSLAETLEGTTTFN